MVTILAGCGQTGDLYLPDDLRAAQLEQQAEVEPDRAAALQAEADQLRQRHQREAALRATLADLEQKEQELREAGELESAEEQLKELNRTRYQLGELILEQQRDR